MSRTYVPQITLSIVTTDSSSVILCVENNVVDFIFDWDNTFEALRTRHQIEHSNKDEIYGE